MTTKIRDLTLTIEFLRNEQRALIEGSGKLLAYGITAHTTAVADRLAAIKTEAVTIADQLAANGAHTHADDARQGWALLMPAPNPQAAS